MDFNLQQSDDIIMKNSTEYLKYGNARQTIMFACMKQRCNSEEISKHWKNKLTICFRSIKYHTHYFKFDECCRMVDTAILELLEKDMDHCQGTYPVSWEETCKDIIAEFWEMKRNWHTKCRCLHMHKPEIGYITA